jgi:hypothetical protein
MRTTMFVTLLMAAIFAPSLLADWQDQAPKGALINQLQSLYPVTVMEANGFKVVKPGTVFVIQKNGIQANPMKSGPFLNTYEDGQVVAGGHGVRAKLNPGGIRASFSQPRILAAGEKAYLLNMVVRDDGIVMIVQTCGICDPAAVDPAHKPYSASIQFNFIKGFWAATDLKHVEVAISSLLAFPVAAPVVSTPPSVQVTQEDPGRPILRRTDGGQPQTQSAAGGTPDQPVKYDDLAPPPPPPPPPTTPPKGGPTLLHPEEIQAQTQAQPQAPPAVREPPKQRAIDSLPPPQTENGNKPKPAAKPDIGWTRDEVRAALGAPDRVDTPRGQEVYRYKDVSVTFEHGKVAAIGSNMQP